MLPPGPAIPGTARHRPRHATDILGVGRTGTHDTTHTTHAVGRGRDGTPHVPDRVTAMSDSDGSPPRDDRLHCRSRTRSPVSPGCTKETPAERQGPRLAEAAVPVGLPAGQPEAPSHPAPPAPERLPAGEAASAAQAAAPEAPPADGAQDAPPKRPHGTAAATQAGHAAALATLSARGTGPTRANGASPSSRIAASLWKYPSIQIVHWTVLNFREFLQFNLPTILEKTTCNSFSTRKSKEVKSARFLPMDNSKSTFPVSNNKDNRALKDLVPNLPMGKRGQDWITVQQKNLQHRPLQSSSGSTELCTFKDTFHTLCRRGN